MATNWQVRSVDDETVAEIKRRARRRGLGIGQYLSWHFTQDVGPIQGDTRKGRKEYKISMNVQAMNRLKRLAADNGYGVPQYLESLAAEEKTNQPSS